MEEAQENLAVPAISQRIRATRERLQEQWKADHPGQRGNPFTQERVAATLRLTTKSYGDYERSREPDLPRLREIARAFNLDEDYFSPTGDLATATARIEAEAERLRLGNDEMQALLATLRAQLKEGSPAPARAEPD